MASKKTMVDVYQPMATAMLDATKDYTELTRVTNDMAIDLLRKNYAFGMKLFDAQRRFYEDATAPLTSYFFNSWLPMFGQFNFQPFGFKPFTGENKA